MEDLAAARVLVTGATGFIGRRLAARLCALGCDVHGVSRREWADGEGPALHWHRADLTDPAAVDALVGGVRPDLVVHLASSVTGSRARDQVRPTLHANLASAVYLLDAIQSAGVRRLILAGSLEEADVAEMVPASPYAAAKAAASSYARMFHALYGTPVVMARLFMVYGPGQLDLAKLVPYVTLALLRDEAPRLGSGNREVDWVYVDDVVEGLVRLLARPGIDGRRVDLGTGILTPVREVVGRLARVIGSQAVPQLGALPERPFEQVRVAEVMTTRHLLDWAPTTGLAEGLPATVAWYRQALTSGLLPAESPV